MTYDPYAVVGATLAVLLFEALQAIRSQRFSWWFLLDTIPAAFVGAIATPGLADVAAANPFGSVLAGGLLALGAKTGLRAVVTKPMQDAHESSVIRDKMIELADNTEGLTRGAALEVGKEVQKASSPQEVAAVVEKLTTICPPQ